MEWVRDILASRLAPLAFALGAVIFLSWQVHHANRPQKHAVKEGALSGISQELPKEGPVPAFVAAFSRQASIGLSPSPVYRVIVSPIAPRSQNPQEVGSAQASPIPTGARKLSQPPISELVQAIVSGAPKAVVPNPARDELQTPLENNDTGGPRAGRRIQATVQTSVKTPKASHSMTMLSIRAQEPDQPRAPENTLSLRCRTDRNVSNSTSADRIVLSGVVTDDVVSASGKILIAAGSKVAGVGQVDSDNGRIKSEGYWSIFAMKRELRVQAKMLDNSSGFPGIEGKETSSESELSQRQAVVRDGRYVFVAARTPFVLNVKGEVSFKELKILESPE
jgi:hypothetical protein